MKRWFWFAVRLLGDWLLTTVAAITCADTFSLDPRCWTCWEQRRYTPRWRWYSYWVMHPGPGEGYPFIREKHKHCPVCHQRKEFIGYEQRTKTLHRGFGGGYCFLWSPIYIEGLSP